MPSSQADKLQVCKKQLRKLSKSKMSLLKNPWTFRKSSLKGPSWAQFLRWARTCLMMMKTRMNEMKNVKSKRKSIKRLLIFLRLRTRKWSKARRSIQIGHGRLEAMNTKSWKTKKSRSWLQKYSIGTLVLSIRISCPIVLKMSLR